MSNSILRSKSYLFAVQVVRLVQSLQSEQKEFVLSKQILRSGTSIGANIREAEFAYTDSDFIYKMNLALKEANETLYWLELLQDTGFINGVESIDCQGSCKELIAMLVSTLKTMRTKLKVKS